MHLCLIIRRTAMRDATDGDDEARWLMWTGDALRSAFCFCKHTIQRCRSIRMSLAKSPRWSRIQEILARHGLPKYHQKSVLDAIYRSPSIKTYQQLTALPAAVRRALANDTADPDTDFLSLHPSRLQSSEQCQKLLFSLKSDRQSIESVWMQFHRSQHTSLCISSQVGCALKCSFCATGAAGFKRQLTVDEITDQVLYFIKQGQRVQSISFMGMGEALMNPRVFDALYVLTEQMQYSPRRLNVSTVGILPGITRLTKEFPKVNLAFSLHSPFVEQRSKLVPTNRWYPLDDVWLALEAHALTTRRKVFIAYLVLPGVNDSHEHAQGIAALFNRLDERARPLFHVNLIRYNQAAGISEQYQRVARDQLRAFIKDLSTNNIPVTIRQSFGTDIDAACGQLWNVERREVERTVSEAAARSEMMIAEHASVVPC